MARGTLVPAGNGSEAKGDTQETPERDETDDPSSQCLGGKREREEEQEALIPYKVGQHIDVLDSVDRWAEAKVLKIDADNRRIFVSFLYWSHHFDTWVTDIRHRTAYIHTHTYAPGGVLRVGQRLDVLDEISKWMEAFVTDENPTEVLIHFKGFSKKFDVWLPRDSPRIRQFGFGENKRNRSIIPQKTWSIPGRPQSIAVDRTRKIVVASDNYVKYANALATIGLHVHPVAGDGNCLFRSVAHQLYGDDSLHDLVREKCMDYMEVNARFFAMFVEGGIENFHEYLAMKRQLACWGDDPEIQAICEIYGRRAEIWCFDPVGGAKRLRTYHESGSSSGIASGSPAMCLSFYGGGHYDSIVGPSFRGFLLTTAPGAVEDTAIVRARNLVASGDRHRERALAFGGARFSDSDAIATSDIEATESAALEMALSSSRRDMEAFGEEDIETCLAISLSETQAKSSSSRLEGHMAESKCSTSSSSQAAGSKYCDLDLDDKAVLELVMKESADDCKRSTGALPMEGQSEEDIIEAQILEQARQESLRLSAGFRSDRDRAEAKAEGSRAPERHDAQEDDLALALQRSEQEMLDQAMLLSQQSYGDRSVAPATLAVDHGAAEADEDEMLRMAIMQSVEMASAQGSSGAAEHWESAGGINDNSRSNISGNFNSIDDEDDDLRRAIAASMQDR